MGEKLPSSKSDSKKENPAAASIVFMVFGLVLVFSSLFLFHSRKNQASFASVRPGHLSNQIDPDASIDRKRKIEGLEINNQRITAEVTKEQEMLNLGNKALNPVDAQDSLMRDVGLTGEANPQDQMHERLKNDRDSYPDVLIPRELARDHAAYDEAIREEQSDRKIFIEGLKRRAAAQNLDVQFDSKTGEIIIDRAPQSVPNGTTSPGVSK